MVELGSVRVSLCLCSFWVISYEQTTQTVHSVHSDVRVLLATLFMLVVLLASPASSAGVHEAEIEGTGGRSHQDVLPSCDGKRASDTHGALS